jgi:ATP-binding cassette subfamily B protein
MAWLRRLPCFGVQVVGDSSSVLSNLRLLELLPPDARQLVEYSFVPVSLPFGSVIVSEGDEADAYYVLASGRARVVKKGENGGEVTLSVMRPGDGFGEMGLLRQERRSASVRASSDVELLRLDRSVFDALAQSHPTIRASLELQTKHRSLQDFFHLYSAFAKLPVAAMRLLTESVETVEVAPGTVVIRQGEPSGPMYVIEEGRLRVFLEQDGRRTYRSYLRKGDFFGEISLFKGTPRTASVEAVSAGKLLKVSPETFQRLLTDYPDFKQQIEEHIAQYDYKKTAHVPLDFAEELLPAEVAAVEKVGLDQLGERAAAREEAEDTSQGPFASDGHFLKRKRRIRRFPHLQQIDEMDCGAASLGMVCRHYGRSVSLARIRQLVHTSLDGTSLRGLCTAAGELGLAARAVKASSDELEQMPLPAIIHWQSNHWIVLYDVGPKQVRVADPATGLRRFSREEFAKNWSGYAALFDYTDAFAQAPEGKPSLTWLWPFVRPFARVLAQALVLAVILSALRMVLPVFTQIIVDKVVMEGDRGLLQTLIVSLVALLGFMVLSMTVQRYLLSFVAVRVDAATLDFLTRKLLALPMSYFQTRRTGDIQRRLAGTREVRQFAVQDGLRGLTATVEIMAAVALMLAYSWKLALVFLIVSPLYAALMYFSFHWLRPIFHSLEEGFGKYFSQQIDVIKGIETVKAMGAEGQLREIILKEFHAIADRQFRADFTIMGYEGALTSVTFLSLVLFLWVGALQVISGAMTIGALVAFNSLVVLANAALVEVLSIWDRLQHTSVLLNRLNDVFEQDPEQGADHSHLRPVRSLEGRVRFQNLSLQYGGPESARILEDITFEIPPGKVVAIVGRSGSGKTSLIKCLAGLVEPTEGTIYYDGVDLKTLNYRQLRRQIGFVLQENFLFNETIARNIAFGEDEPDMDRVLVAARAANAHDFIERLPLGYETWVGESGLGLSGGQRQRIAIARALYPRPPILVFDEATSALDTESERTIQDNMDQLLHGRTAFIIAHRLSTIRNADVILVLEKGRLVERGTHEELMKLQGLYYYLCSQQLGL